MGKVTAILNKIKQIFWVAVNYVKGLPKNKLWLYVGIAAGVILLLIIVSAVVKANRSNPNAAYHRAYRRYLRRSLRQSRKDKYYRPRKRRVRYVKTKASKANKKKVQYVYTPADQSAMLATGIFGVSLGIMAHRALLEEQRNLRNFYL